MNLEKHIQEKWTNVMRKKFITINGFLFSDIFANIKNDINNLEVRNEDVWVCSFPRSGTTWTQEMVWMICNNLDFEGAKLSLDQRSPFLEVCGTHDYQNFMKKYPQFKMPPYKLESVNYVKNHKNPRIIKTHLAWEFLPKQIQNGNKKPKIIYVARNPKDVCVSFYHHARLNGGYKGKFDEFCELFLVGKVIFGPYWKNVLSYWKMRSEQNFYFLRYEDMKQDLGKTIKKIAEFLERSLNDDQVDLLKDHLSFEKMKQNPAINREESYKIYKQLKLTDSDKKFFRLGKTGDHKTAMTPEKVKRFDEWIKSNTENTDYVVLNNVLF